MNNAIKVGHWIIDADRIEAIQADGGTIDVWGDRGDSIASFRLESEEGRALLYWYAEADRSLRAPGLTVDVVLEYRRAVAEGTTVDPDKPRIAIPGRDEVYAQNIRNHAGYPVGISGSDGAA